MDRKLSVALGAVLAISLWVAPSAAGVNPFEAPDPGGSDTLEVPVPPPGGKTFGFTEDRWETDPWNATAKRVAEIGANAGANAQRFEVSWWAVQPTPGEWNETNWSHYQRMYDALVARNMRPVLNVGFAPPWARDSGYPRLCGQIRGCEYPPATHMTYAWREFVAEVARRFPRAVIEIWNEPNMNYWWRPYPQPERYAFLVAHAYAAIKAVRPTTTVLAGALAPAQKAQSDANGQQTVIPMSEFLNRAYSASPISIRGKMDALSFHFHAEEGQELSYGEDTLYAKAFKDMRSVPREHGDPHRLWITEAGLSTIGTGAVSHHDQAAGLLRQYRRSALMPDVDGFLIHTLLQDPTIAPTGRRKGFGVVRAPDPFEPKLAYCAFANRVPTPIAITSCPPGIFMPGERGGGDNPGIEPRSRCEIRLAHLLTRRARIRRKIRVYLPDARAGHRASQEKVHKLRRKMRVVKRRIARKRARCG